VTYTPKPRSPLYHFPNLPADIHERLAARGIDPDRAAESWLQAIRDGRFPVSAFAARPAGYKRLRPQANRESSSPGASYIPFPIPLALVLPAST
jgi:hypothetical protein